MSFWAPVGPLWVMLPDPAEAARIVERRAAPHEGEPVLAYDFQIMTTQQLMQLEWRKGFHLDTALSERQRIAFLADAELTRRGVHERYT